MNFSSSSCSLYIVPSRRHCSLVPNVSRCVAQLKAELMAARKVPNFCEAALSVSYNRRFLWNDFVELTTLLGFFFLFWTDAFCGRFQMQTTLLVLREFANYSKSMDIWYTVQVFFPKVLQLELISFFIHIKSNYSTSKCTYSNYVRFVMYIFYPQNPPVAGETLNIANPVFAAVFGVPAYVSDDRWPGEGCWDPPRHVTRGQRRFLWANGGRQGDDLVVVAQ